VIQWRYYVRAAVKRWGALACVIFVFGLLSSVTRAQEGLTLDTLTIDGIMFSNVTIISQTDTHVSFKHAQGFSTVKLTQLPAKDQTKVGYTPPPPPKSLADRAKEYSDEYTEKFATWMNDPRIKTLEQDIRTEVDRVLTEQDKVIIYPVVGGVVCIYFLFCLAAIKICRKTTVRPGLYVWLPGFQWISLLKAAGMSPWNFLLLFIPPINLIVMAVWCFKICRTRQKSSALGFLLLIPGINILVYFYLAFSSQKHATQMPYEVPRLKLSFNR